MWIKIAKKVTGIPTVTHAEALDENPAAAAFFATLNSQNRYAILYRIQDARRPETRARRLEKFVAMLNEGTKLHP